MVSHLLLHYVVSGYGRDEENDKEKTIKGLKTKTSGRHRLPEASYAFNLITNRLPLPSSLSTVNVPP